MAALGQFRDDAQPLHQEGRGKPGEIRRHLIRVIAENQHGKQARFILTQDLARPRQNSDRCFCGISNREDCLEGTQLERWPHNSDLVGGPVW